MKKPKWSPLNINSDHTTTLLKNLLFPMSLLTDMQDRWWPLYLSNFISFHFPSCSWTTNRSNWPAFFPWTPWAIVLFSMPGTFFQLFLSWLILIFKKKSQIKHHLCKKALLNTHPQQLSSHSLSLIPPCLCPSQSFSKFKIIMSTYFITCLLLVLVSI